MSDKHVIAILLENEAGVLFRVAGLFSARGYNIESLTVARTNNPALSRMTVVTSSSDRLVNQIISQLNKLVGVVRIQDLSRDKHTEREALLVKIRCAGSDDKDARVVAVAQQYNADIVMHENDTCLLELIAPTGKVDQFIADLSEYSIVEVVRSGVISLGDNVSLQKNKCVVK